MKFKQTIKLLTDEIKNIFRKKYDVLVEIRGLNNEFLSYEKLAIRKGEAIIDAFKKNPKFKVGKTSLGEIIQGYENNQIFIYEGLANKENSKKYKDYKVDYYEDFRKGQTGHGIEVYILNEGKAHFITTTYNGMEYRPGLGNIIYDCSKPLKLILKHTDFKEDIENSYKVKTTIKKEQKVFLPNINLQEIQKSERFLSSINYELTYFFNLEKKYVKNEKEWLFKPNSIERNNFEFNRKIVFTYLEKYFIGLFYQRSILPFYSYLPNYSNSLNKKDKKTQKLSNQLSFYKNFLLFKSSSKHNFTFSNQKNFNFNQDLKIERKINKGQINNRITNNETTKILWLENKIKNKIQNPYLKREKEIEQNEKISQKHQNNIEYKNSRSYKKEKKERKKNRKILNQNQNNSKNKNKKRYQEKMKKSIFLVKENKSILKKAPLKSIRIESLINKKTTKECKNTVWAKPIKTNDIMAYQQINRKINKGKKNLEKNEKDQVTTKTKLEKKELKKLVEYKQKNYKNPQSKLENGRKNRKRERNAKSRKDVVFANSRTIK